MLNGGIFHYFPEFAAIEVSKIASWLGCARNPEIVENKLGNRALYPQAIPVSREDLIFDLCLLREALKIQPQNYYNQNLKRICINGDFLEMFPNLQELSFAFIDALNPLGITSIVTRVENMGFKNLGTLIKPEELPERGFINFFIRGNKYKISVGSLTCIPAQGQRVDIKLDSETIKLLGKNSLSTEVMGGDLGVIIDTRKHIASCGVNSKK